MIRDDKIIQKLIHGDMVEKIAANKNIGIVEARQEMSSMSFKQYMALDEVVTPPSGQTIGPVGPAGLPGAKPTNMAQPAPVAQGQNTASGGLPAPPVVGQTVNVPGQNNLPMPAEITRVNTGQKTVTYKNPTTGREEDVGIDQLTPFAGAGTGPGATASKPEETGGTTQPATAMAEEIARMKYLAGIKEDCSGGATGAGAIAVAPAPVGNVVKRKQTKEECPVEESPSLEHPVAGRKSIVGATGPQASPSKKLSANNAVRGLPTPNRKNLGRKR